MKKKAYQTPEVPVRMWANTVCPTPIVIRDHLGKLWHFRKFVFGASGLTDIKAERIIIPAEWESIDVSTRYESIVCGKVHRPEEWKAFSLEGEPLFEGRSFASSTDIYNMLEESCSQTEWWCPID